MSNAASAAAWCQSDWLLVAIVPAALMAGRLLVRGVDGLSEPRPRAAGRPPLIEVATAVAAAAIWWWEVRGLGQLSATPASADLFVVCLRYLAHLFFFFLLAAAAWVDLRDRVIPDSITVPGVVLGLAWNATLPQTLLPIEHAVERSFAPPTMEPDVLGAFGPLEHLGLPGWLIGSAGLAATLALFAVWWWFGLPPAGTAGEAEASHPDARVARLRLPIGCVGAAGLVAAWLAGGDHWAGVVTAIVGMAVAGGMIWATRAGASRALGREAMGFGDVTLMAMAGSWLGWQACVLACVLAVFIGLAHGIMQLVRHSESELPFGPSLCLGLAIVVLAWRPLWAAAAPQFERPTEMAVVVTLVIGLTAATLWAWSRLRSRSF
jgi:leader peptidase (prepilin peptidase)/N-methyltransferase